MLACHAGSSPELVCRELERNLFSGCYRAHSGRGAYFEATNSIRSEHVNARQIEPSFDRVACEATNQLAWTTESIRFHLKIVYNDYTIKVYAGEDTALVWRWASNRVKTESTRDHW
jgi:hypothetical protein